MKNSLTKEDIMKKIVKTEYTALEDGKTTIANVYLENGYTVQGSSACVDPANYNKRMGESIAFENAVDKVWQLEGYLLAQHLYEEKHIDETLNYFGLKPSTIKVIKESIDKK